MAQILEYGGVSHVDYDNVGSGWWHKTLKNWLGITTHTHSQSWTLSDVFTKYFGDGYSTTSNYSFSCNIVAGDFISADFTSDGDWEHMGFVQQNLRTHPMMDITIIKLHSTHLITMLGQHRQQTIGIPLVTMAEYIHE